MRGKSWSTRRWCWSGSGATTRTRGNSSESICSRRARSRATRKAPANSMASETSDDDEPFGLRVVTLEAGGRVDKALAEALPEFSRARIQALMAEGRVSRGGAPVTDGSAKTTAGDYRLEIPPP